MSTFTGMTFKEKVAHFWDYYKIHTIAGIVVLCIILYTANECANRVEPDLRITYVSEEPLTDASQKKLEQYLENTIEDINADGKKYVMLSPLAIDMSGSANSGVFLQKLFLDINTGDSTLFITDSTFRDYISHQDGVVEKTDNITDSEFAKDIGFLHGEVYLLKRNIYEPEKGDLNKLGQFENTERIYRDITGE